MNEAPKLEVEVGSKENCCPHCGKSLEMAAAPEVETEGKLPPELEAQITEMFKKSI
jgi:hypothetical protein